MQTLGIVLAALAAVVLVAALRQPLEHVIRAVVELPIRALTAGRGAATAARVHIQDTATRSRAALGYGSTAEARGSAWDVTAPLVYLVLLAVILYGDIVLASLRFGALLGIPVDGLPIEGSLLDLLTGLLFLQSLRPTGASCWTSQGSPRCAVHTGSSITEPAQRSRASPPPGRPCRCLRRRCSSCGGNTPSSARRARTSRRCSSRSSPCCSSGRASSPRVAPSAP